jgi:hypothetical protein
MNDLPNIYEIRDPVEARQHVLQSLWLSRIVPPTQNNVPLTLRWCRQILRDGSPLPPIGFVADMGNIAIGAIRDHTGSEEFQGAGANKVLARRYDDYVLGKLYADMSFERGCEALLRYQGGDRIKGLAFLANQVRDRCGFGGVLLSPAVLKTIEAEDINDVLAEAWQSLEQDGLLPQLVTDLEQLIEAIRTTGEVLGTEDIFELEHGTALADFGQRVALRQVLRAADELSDGLPNQKPRVAPRRYSVATNIMDEDAYPVGGFSSISNKGTVESLLRSELAYIDRETRPDLFDIRYVRGELLYYSRDENQFLRRRLTYIIALYPDLTNTRFKDASLPWQRIILILASIIVGIRKITEWQSEDSLSFDIMLVDQAETEELTDESTLLETLLREQIQNGTVSIEHVSSSQLAAHCDQRAKTSLCHCLTISSTTRPVPSELPISSQLTAIKSEPHLVLDDEPIELTETALPAWKEALEQLLRHWV